MYYFCTYFDRNYLVRGLALYQSLMDHIEKFRLFVLCHDDSTFEFLTRMRLASVQPIALPEFERDDCALLEAKSNRSRVEYYFTCTPSLPLYVLSHFDDIDVITYLDADLYFYSSPAPIYDELGGQSILIVGHRFTEKQKSFEKFGIYNVGLLAFRNDAHGRACLHWWRERCLEWCHDRVEADRFADQKYLDDWPQRFGLVVVLQHKGAGLAPWNWSRYRLSLRNGRVFVDDDLLIFFHFHKLKVLTMNVFDIGFSGQRFSCNAILRKNIYTPYLLRLKTVTSLFSIKNAGSLRSKRGTGMWSFLRSLVYGKKFLLIGEMSIIVDLEPLAKAWLRLKGNILKRRTYAIPKSARAASAPVR